MKKLVFLTIVIVSTFGLGHRATAQFYAAKVNALAMSVGVLDLGVEVSITDNWSLDIASQLSIVNMTQRVDNLYGGEIGAKYWFFENYVGHFIGQQLKYINYNVGRSRSIYDGEALGFGVSYGYAWILSPRWSLVAEVGVGIFYNRDIRKDPVVDDWSDEYIYHSTRITVAPSRLAISFNYLF